MSYPLAYAAFSFVAHPESIESTHWAFGVLTVNAGPAGSSERVEGFCHRLLQLLFASATLVFIE